MTRSSYRAKRTKAILRPSPSGSAAKWLGEVTPGLRLVGVNKGQFSMIDLISAVLDQVGSAEVVVSTWTPGKKELDNVAQMLSKGLITCFRLLVDRSFVTRHPEYVDRVNALFGPDTIRKTRTHMKVALITSGDYRIVIRSSANFNTNPNLEQFDLDDDADIYNFFEALIDDLFETVPPGLQVPSPDIVRHFARWDMGSAFVMDEDDSADNDLALLGSLSEIEDLLKAMNND